MMKNGSRRRMIWIGSGGKVDGSIVVLRVCATGVIVIVFVRAGVSDGQFP